MKLRAITLAAAGLLAAASAQAELQTWRFTDVHAGRSDESIDVVFDTSAPIGEAFDALLFQPSIGFNAWVSPIVSWSFNGTTYKVSENNWIPTEGGQAIIWNNKSSPTNDAEDVFFAAIDPAGLFEARDNSLAKSLDLLASQVSLIAEQAATDWEVGYDTGSEPVLVVTSNITGLQFTTALSVNRMERVTAVPEPSAWALALLGGVGAVALARRRQPARQAEALTA